MIVKQVSGILFFLCLVQMIFAQQMETVQVQFSPTWQHQKVTIPFTGHDEKYKDSTQIELFRCYVSQVELWCKNKLVWSEKESFHLLDAEIDSSLVLKLNVPKKLKYNQVKFRLGIDSTTSVSGAMGGDLDPTKGMFWAWNTGYINFKLEGSNPVCKTRKNEFQFHLGGYAGANATIQDVALKIRKKERKINIDIQLDKFMDAIDLAKKNSVMTPGKETVELAKITKGIFKVKK